MVDGEVATMGRFATDWSSGLCSARALSGFWVVFGTCSKQDASRGGGQGLFQVFCIAIRSQLGEDKVVCGLASGWPGDKSWQEKVNVVLVMVGLVDR